MNKLIFGDIQVSKKEFYEGKKAIRLSLVDVDKIVVSNKIKGNNETSKFFIGYVNKHSLDDISDIVTPLCIILPQMSGWIKILKMVVNTCHLELKMMKCILNTIISGIRLKNY